MSTRLICMIIYIVGMASSFVAGYLVAKLSTTPYKEKLSDDNDKKIGFKGGRGD